MLVREEGCSEYTYCLATLSTGPLPCRPRFNDLTWLPLSADSLEEGPTSFNDPPAVFEFLDCSPALVSLETKNLRRRKNSGVQDRPHYTRSPAPHGDRSTSSPSPALAQPNSPKCPRLRPSSPSRSSWLSPWSLPILRPAATAPDHQHRNLHPSPHHRHPRQKTKERKTGFRV